MGWVAPLSGHRSSACHESNAKHPLLPGAAGPVGVALLRPPPGRHDRVRRQQAQHEQHEPPLPHDRCPHCCSRPHQAAARRRRLSRGRIETPARNIRGNRHIRAVVSSERQLLSNQAWYSGAHGGSVGALTRLLLSRGSHFCTSQHLRSKMPLSRLKMGRRVASLRSGCRRGDSGSA